MASMRKNMQFKRYSRFFQGRSQFERIFQRDQFIIGCVPNESRWRFEADLMDWIEPVSFGIGRLRMAKGCDLAEPQKIGQRIVRNSGLDLGGQDIINHRIAEDQGIRPEISRRPTQFFQQELAVPLCANARCQMATGGKTANRNPPRIDQPSSVLASATVADQPQGSSHIQQRSRKN